MNKREIPAALRRAAEQLPMPHSQELWEMPVSKQTELDYITAQELPQVPTRRRAFLPALTCCIVLLFFGWFWQYRMVETTVFLDVNPSIQITANRRDRVLEVTGLNADGRSLIEGQVFSGLPLPTVLGQLADKFGARKATFSFYLLTTAGFGLCCLAGSGSMYAAVSSVVVLGFGVSIAALSSSLFAAEMVPSGQYASAVRTFQLVFTLGNLSASSLPGIVADLTGSYISSFAGFAVLTALSMVAVQLGYRSLKSKDSPIAHQE